MPSIKLPSVLLFEWDKGNEQKNWINHNVSGEEAEEPFFTENHLLLDDIVHSSEEEKRYILLGKTKQARMLFIAFTIRREKIRIISARDADRKEVLLYEKALSIAKV